MPEKNKKTSGDEQCDCEQDEREKQDRAEDEHPPGHLRIGAEDQRDRTEEHDAAPSASFRSALLCLRRNLRRLPRGQPRHWRRCAGRPEEEREEKSEEDEEDPEESERA